MKENENEIIRPSNRLFNFLCTTDELKTTYLSKTTGLRSGSSRLRYRWLQPLV